MVDVSRELRAMLPSVRTGNSKLHSFSNLPIMKHGFFPGGNGLYEGNDSRLLTPARTLVLGSNFGCVGEFISSEGRLSVQDERGNQTWRPLLKLLRDSDIVISECFFTNAWPFLHDGEGNLPKALSKNWLTDRDLMISCLEFFCLTLTRVNPNLIIALGAAPAAFLSHRWPDYLGLWRGCSLSCLDDLPMGEISFANVRAVCVAVCHPSMPNSWRRRPPYQGREGEILLLREARVRAEALRADDGHLV